jgi:hypothetical protein
MGEVVAFVACRWWLRLWTCTADIPPLWLRKGWALSQCGWVGGWRVGAACVHVFILQVFASTLIALLSSSGCVLLAFNRTSTNVQVALMGLIASAVAALDAHPGIAEVAKCGLGFLQHQVAVPENQVTWVAVVLNIGRYVYVSEKVYW